MRGLVERLIDSGNDRPAPKKGTILEMLEREARSRVAASTFQNLRLLLDRDETGAAAVAVRDALNGPYDLPDVWLLWYRSHARPSVTWNAVVAEEGSKS